MSGVQQQVERIKALGLPGLDVRHIGVYVEPSLRVEGQDLVQTHAAYVGENDGNFAIDFPTKLIFVIMSGGWEFERFELDGRSWDGIAILPSDHDFQVVFGDPERQSVIVLDDCRCFYTYRYQIALRNRRTGERVVVDPGVENRERQGPTPPEPPEPPEPPQPPIS
jgi:hypothetical protein